MIDTRGQGSMSGVFFIFHNLALLNIFSGRIVLESPLFSLVVLMCAVHVTYLLPMRMGRRCDPDMGGCNQFHERSIKVHKLPKGGWS